MDQDSFSLDLTPNLDRQLLLHFEFSYDTRRLSYS